MQIPMILNKYFNTIFILYCTHFRKEFNAKIHERRTGAELVGSWSVALGEVDNTSKATVLLKILHLCINLFNLQMY